MAINLPEGSGTHHGAAITNSPINAQEAGSDKERLGTEMHVIATAKRSTVGTS